MLFNNYKNFYVLANIDLHTLDGFIQRRKLLSGTSKYTPHITLFTAILNVDNKYTKLFYSTDFKNFIIKTYYKTLININLYSKKGNYEILGDTKKFFVRMYEPSNKTMITTFRTNIYNKIKQMLNINDFIIHKSDQYVYFIIPNSSTYLFAVPTHSYGVGVWKPHVSIVHDTDTTNNNIRNLILNNDANSITKYFKGNNLMPLTNIDMSRCNIVIK